MAKVRICDCRDCPAIAQRRVDLYGQDFHFCAHHFAELSPVLSEHISPFAADLERRRSKDADDPRLSGAGSGRASR